MPSAGAVNKHLDANRALWDEWTGINYRSDFYRVDAFKTGLNKLRVYEIEEVGAVEGKDLAYGWNHGLGEIVTALANAGLRVDFLHEFPFCEWPVSFLQAQADGTHRLPPEQDGRLPLFFSLKASKP